LRHGQIFGCRNIPFGSSGLFFSFSCYRCHFVNLEQATLGNSLFKRTYRENSDNKIIYKKKNV